jgi:hypothetical protein
MKGVLVTIRLGKEVMKSCSDHVVRRRSDGRSSVGNHVTEKS